MDRAEFLARVDALVPGIRARAAHTEALRRLPDETFKELQEAGIMRALQPRSWGGSELDPAAFFQGVLRLAAACASTGWFTGVVGVHDWQLALFDRRAQEEVWSADPTVLISSSYQPTGEVEPVDGGYRLRGRWSFSSGCDQCEWAFLGGIIRPPDDAPEMRTFLVPRRDYEIDDVWHVAGLAGSGSKDIVVADAFVPEHRTHRFLDAFKLHSPGQAENTGPLYRLPFGCMFSYTLAVPPIGVARGAVDLFREQAAARSEDDRARLADDPFVAVRLADAAADVDAARDRLHAVWERMYALAVAGAEIPIELRTRCRRDAGSAVGLAVRAVDRVFEVSGGRAIFLHNPMQRLFRDVHAMRAHAWNNPERSARVFGRQQLAPDDDDAPRDLLY